jgi:hypothetical protein
MINIHCYYGNQQHQTLIPVSPWDKKYNVHVLNVLLEEDNWGEIDIPQTEASDVSVIRV